MDGGPSTPGLFLVMMVNAVVLGAFGVIFTPLYAGVVPLPLGALISVLILPWLVLRCAELWPRAAGAPVLAWLLTVGALAFVGPGGDVMLPATWQSLVLVVGGLGAGLLAVRHAVTAPAPRETSR